MAYSPYDPTTQGSATANGDRKKLFIVCRGNSYSGSGGGGQQSHSGALNFGPFVNLCSWEPVGHQQRAVAMKWTISFDALNPDVHPTQKSWDHIVLQKHYECRWSVDVHGLTERTISGFIDFNGVKNGDNQIIINRKTPSIPTAADDYRHLVDIRRLSGFERTQSYVVSPSKTRLTFVVSDKQIATNNPYPAGISKINARHSASWELERTEIVQSIDCTMTRTNLHSNPYLCWNYFRALIASRLNVYSDEGKEFSKNAAYILKSLSVSEDIFGLDSSFSASYYQPKSLRSFFKSSQLWKPVVLNTVTNPSNPNVHALFNEGFDQWTAESAASVGQHGKERVGRSVPLRYVSEDEVVLDIDSITPFFLPKPTKYKGNVPAQNNVFVSGDEYKAWTYDENIPLPAKKPKKNDTTPGDTLAEHMLNANPPSQSEKPQDITSENSYIRVDIETEVTRVNPVVIQSPVVYYDHHQKNPADLVAQDQPASREEKAVANIVDQSGPPVVHVSIYGVLERLKWAPIIPLISKYRGQDVYEVRRKVRTKAIRNAGGVAVVRSKFAIVYAVSGIPDGTFVPINPLDGIGSRNNDSKNIEADPGSVSVFST